MVKWIRSLFRRRPAPQPHAIVPGHEWYNAVQEELCAALTVAGELPLSNLETLQTWSDTEMLRGKSYQELFRAYTAEHTLADHEWLALLATASDLVSRRTV